MPHTLKLKRVSNGGYNLLAILQSTCSKKRQILSRLYAAIAISCANHGLTESQDRITVCNGSKANK